MATTRPTFDEILGPPQDLGAILGPPQDMDAILDRAYTTPAPVPQDDAEMVREYEREAFLEEADPQAPQSQTPGVPREDPDMLGLDLPATRADELQPAFQASLDAEQEQIRNVTLNPEVLADRAGREKERKLRATITPGQRNIGNFAESNILLHTDGYVRNPDGTARKASGLELLVQSMGRQTLYAGLDYEQRIAELKAQKEQRIQQGKAEGKSDREARDDAEAFFQNTLTEVDLDRREIRETFAGAMFRNMGLVESAISELVFDTLPYFYEVDDLGEMQNPDSWMDQLAHLVDTARAGAAETVGLTEAAGETVFREAVQEPALRALSPFAANPLVTEFLPVAFNAIDRDRETSIPESGLRVAADTGGFFSDIFVANARGRTYHDELMSVTSERERLGEYQWLSMIPAMYASIGTPGGPLDLVNKTFKVAKSAALTGKLGLTAKSLAQSADASKWAQAFRVQAELLDLYEDPAEVTLDVGDIVRGNGDPARAVANRMADQLATPYQMRATVLDPNMTMAELEGVASNDLGRHILARTSQRLPDATGEIDAVFKDALLDTIAEWRVGVEAGTVAQALRKTDDLRPMKVRLQTAIEDAAGVDNYRRVASSDLYRPAIQAAAEGKSAGEVADLLQGARMVAGSAPLRTTNVRVRQILAMADEAASRGAKAGLKTQGPLKALLRASSDISPNSPDSVKFGSAINVMMRRGFEELVDVHMPRDVTFVTDRLMVPKRLNTPKIRQEVGVYERALYSPEVVKGKFLLKGGLNEGGVNDKLRAVLDDALPSGVTPRIEAMVAQPGGMTPREHSIIANAVREAGWRKAVGNKNALEATIEGRMTARARDQMGFTEEVLRPLTDRVMAAVHATNRATDAIVSRLPASVTSKAVVQNVLEYQKNWDSNQMKKWLTSYNDLTPTAYKQVLDQQAEAVGVIQRNYRRDLRALMDQARQGGAENPGGAAIARYTDIQWRRLGTAAVEKLRRNVGRIRAKMEEQLPDPSSRPNDAEIYAQALFDSASIRPTNIGFSLDMVRKMSVDEQRKFIGMVEALAQRAEKKRQWRNLLRAFFTTVKSRQGDEKVKSILDQIDLLLDDVIIDNPNGRAAARLLKNPKLSDTEVERLKLIEKVANSAILKPTSGNIRKVVDKLRDPKEGIEELVGRGAATRRPTAPLRGRDAILRTEQTWQMSVDQQLVTSRILEDFFDQNPEFVTVISPNNGRTSADVLAARRAEYQAPISVRLSVLDGLRALERSELGEEAGTSTAYFKAKGYVRDKAQHFGQRQQVAGQTIDPPIADDGGFIKRGPGYRLEQWALHRMREFGPEQRAAATQRILNAMHIDATLYPSRGGSLAGILGTADNTNELSVALDAMLLRVDARRGADPASDYIKAAVKRLRAAGVEDIDIKMHLGKYAHYGIDNAVTPFLENQVRTSLRNFGFTSFATPGSINKAITSFEQLPLDEVMALPIAPGLRDIIDNLRVQAANGKMLDALEDLHARTLLKDKEYGQFALRMFGDFFESTKQMAAYGLLSAGIVFGGPIGIMAGLPISRYIGLNILTAPLMMVGTLGTPRALSSIGMAAKDVGRKVAKRAFPNTVAPRGPNDIVFRDTYGKEWTQQEFDALCESYNIFMSRAEVDQTANVFRTIERELRVFEDTSGVKKQPWYRTALSFMDPSREAPGMQFAVWTDTVFRRGAFAASLRDGHTPMEAANIARAAVLDYGAVPDTVKNHLNKYLLFATFKTASTDAMLRSIASGRDDWLKVMKLQMQIQKAAGTWTFGADHDKVRSYAIPGPEFDYRKSAVVGPQEVMASASLEMIDATAFAIASMAQMSGAAPGAAGDIVGRAIAGFQEENLQPAIQAAMAMVINQRPTSRGRLVPDTWILSVQRAGLWDEAVERFNIHEVGPLQERDDRRPGAPEFDGVQYVFEGTGYRDFVAFSYLSLVLTLGRANDDMSRTIAASPYPPDGYDPKYRAIVPWYMYMTGAATPIRLPSKEDIFQRSLRRDR